MKDGSNPSSSSVFKDKPLYADESRVFCRLITMGVKCTCLQRLNPNQDAHNKLYFRVFYTLFRGDTDKHNSQTGREFLN